MNAKTVRRRGRNWTVPAIVIAVLAAVILLSLGLGGADSREQSAAEDPAGQQTGADSATDSQQSYEEPDFSFAERHDPSDLTTTGTADAPVTLVVFSDYQCPFCAQWSHDSLPAMLEYVEAGDLRIEWRDLMVFGAESEQAALASYAAAKQDAYLEFHDALFLDNQIRTESELSEDALVALAAELGLDAEQFATDMAAPETAAAVASNQQLAQDLGVNSTPIFILGGTPIIGAQPTEVFTNTLEDKLAAVKE